MDVFYQWMARVRETIDITLFRVGSASITTSTALYVIVAAILIVWISKWLQVWVTGSLLRRSRLDNGGRHAAGVFVRYVILFGGLFLLIQSTGVDLTTFTVLAGALGIGAGFGLQTIVSNLFAGLLIMLERPIKLGDRIEVNGVQGDVVEIGARATVVRTNDNIAIIVPNATFISENVVNWSYNDRRVRFRIPVSVSYGSDVRQVEALLLEVARAVPGVLESPEPGVRFVAFGEVGLEFELRAWTSSLVHRGGQLVSALNFEIYQTFNEHGIGFPFPQRQVQLTRGVTASPTAKTDRTPQGPIGQD